MRSHDDLVIGARCIIGREIVNIFCLKWGNFELLDVFLVYFKVQNFMNKN